MVEIHGLCVHILEVSGSLLPRSRRREMGPLPFFLFFPPFVQNRCLCGFLFFLVRVFSSFRGKNRRRRHSSACLPMAAPVSPPARQWPARRTHPECDSPGALQLPPEMAGKFPLCSGQLRADWTLFKKEFLEVKNLADFFLSKDTNYPQGAKKCRHPTHYAPIPSLHRVRPS